MLGGRAPAFIIAAAATLAFSLALPPFGSLRIRLGEDVVALVVFSAVAFVASALVTTKMDTLHDVDAQRRALLRSVSHDLRTPLSAIHAVATDLRSGTTYDDATRNELLDIMIDETDRLDRFVANLLSMSRIEAGTLRPDMQPVDVTELLERVTHRFERSGARAITLDVPVHLPFVRGDHTQLEQVVSNLLDNAVQHTPATAKICVSARAEPRAVAITVSDDGPGLPAAVRERMESGTPDASAGLGLAHRARDRAPARRYPRRLRQGTRHVIDREPSRCPVKRPCSSSTTNRPSNGCSTRRCERAATTSTRPGPAATASSSRPRCSRTCSSSISASPTSTGWRCAAGSARGPRTRSSC